MTPENKALADDLALDRNNLYFDFAEHPDGSLSCCARLIFTTGIYGELNRVGYERRWCYKYRADALEAHKEWVESGALEPCGWLRDTHTGRRQYLELSDWVVFAELRPELNIGGPFSVFSNEHFWC